MISVRNVSRYYGDFSAVKSLSFEISRGEIVGLLGHNGAGKSTIMKIISGYLEPSQGQLSISGFDVVKQRQQAQQLVGYLPENLPIYPDMKVIDYLDYVGQLCGLAERQRYSSLSQTVQATDLMDKIHEPIDTLSRGYKQRVAVAGAIIGDPKVLILDEPTNGLDPLQTQLMRRLIRTISAQTTVILSTHIMQEVEAICDRVLLMNDGQLQLDTPLAELHQTHALSIQTNATASVLETITKNHQAIQSLTQLDHQTHLLKLDSSLSADALLKLSASINKNLLEKGAEVYQIQQPKRDLESLFQSN